MPDKATNSPKRLLHMDLLRLLAIFLVIFNHTGNRGFLLFADNTDSPLYFLYMAASVFCKVAVPIFFMISGALLLPKQESLGKLFSKRILRMVVVLVVVSVPYYFWLHRAEGMGVSSFLTYIYGNSASTSLWYLYSYVALLLMMPFLRSMVKALHNHNYLYLLAGHIVLFGVLPCLEYCLWQGNHTYHESFTPVIFITPNIFYALMGYYLEHIVDYKKNNVKVIGFGVLCSLIALVVTCAMTHYQTKLVEDCGAEQLEQFFNCFICIPAMTLYYSTKHLCRNIQGERAHKVLPILGGTVFGIYLIEKFSRALTDIVYRLLSPVIGSFIASLVWSFVALCLSFIVVVFLKHTPVLKKIVNKFI